MLIDFDVSEVGSDLSDEIPVLSDRLSLEELEAEGISAFSAFLALTNSSELNGILAQRALELFRPNLIAMLSSLLLGDGNSLSAIAPRIQVDFAPQISLELWNQFLTQNEAQLVKIALKSPSFSVQQTELQTLIASNELLPLLIERDQDLRIIFSDEAWQVGDRITCSLHRSTTSASSLSLTQPISLAMT